MNVLSLFNGMNTGRQALENAGVKINKYYSSELKPYAIELTQFHFPDTIQLGDILNWKEWDIDWKSIDLVLSGSPCQDLSGAGNRKGIYGDKSSLFWVFIEILEHIKTLNPNVLFLQENVGSASKKDIGIMSRALGLYPVRINSKLVTGQQRDRYYWTNIRTKETMFDIVTDIPQPDDRKIYLKDVIETYWGDKPVRFADINNCVGCFHRNELLLNKLANGPHKNKFDWFADQEIGRNGKGTWRTGITYDKIQRHSVQVEIPYSDFSDCDSGYCGI